MRKWLPLDISPLFYCFISRIILRKIKKTIFYLFKSLWRRYIFSILIQDGLNVPGTLFNLVPWKLLMHFWVIYKHIVKKFKALSKKFNLLILVIKLTDIAWINWRKTSIKNSDINSKFFSLKKSSINDYTDCFSYSVAATI